MTTNRMGLTPEQAANTFTDAELEAMIAGNNPQSNVYRELLEYRKASKQPSISVQFKDGWPIPELVGLIVGAEKLPDGLHDFYTAPPLQAVAVPDEITFDDVVAIKSVEYSLSNTGITGYRDGWNDCIKSMRGDKK